MIIETIPGCLISCINPLQPGVAFLYPLKTLENLKVLMFSGDIEKQHPAEIG